MQHADKLPTGVLDDVRVLDFGRYIAGPYCAALLGDFGAEVIRVERTGGAEDRVVLPLAGDDGGAMFLPLNRNKKSVSVDPTSDDGREVVRRLVRTADVVVANLPPQGLKALGLDYESLKAIKPDIILTSMNAFGSEGPWRERVGFDGVAQAMSSLCYMTGQPGQPTKFYGPWVDFSAGMLAAMGTMAALTWRTRTGQGQEVQSSLLMAALVPGAGLLTEQAYTGIDRQPNGNRSQTGAPADMFRTKDGWIIVQVVSQALFKRWARLMGEDIWLADERFKDDPSRVINNAAINDRMSAWCAQRTTDQALAELEKMNLPAGPVLNAREVLAHEQVNAIGAFTQVDYPGLDKPATILNTPVKLTASPGTVRTPPPVSGQHTDEVLHSLGYDEAQLVALRERRVI
ncbi:MAG: CoA transferase [Pseudomonadota bacterium]